MCVIFHSNLFRDPRWGRGQEVPGEDPTLTSEYVMHYSRGMQEGVDTRYLKVISTTKHYADYDQEDSDGTNRVSFNAIVVSEQRVACFVRNSAAADACLVLCINDLSLLKTKLSFTGTYSTGGGVQSV